jgi:hypothetical protein
VLGLRVEQRDGMTLVMSRWLVAPGAAATTIGSVVFVRRGAERSARLLRHEAVHVRQYRTLGVVGFLRRYVTSYVRWRLRWYSHWAAYRRIPLEIEAEWRARRRE